jgi:hypothetical protein
VSEALPPITEGSVAPHFAALCAKIQAEARQTAAQPGPAAALNAAILALLALLVGAFAVLFARLEAGESLAQATPPRRTPNTKALSPRGRGLGEGSPRAVPMLRMQPPTHRNPAAPQRRRAAIHAPAAASAPSRGRPPPFLAFRRCRPGATAKNAAPAHRRLTP